MDARDPDDPDGTYLHPRSFAELLCKRELAVMDLREPSGGFTCDDCRAVWRCVYAFDPYNTGGDCLADK